LEVVHGGDGIFPLVCMDLGQSVMDFWGARVITERAFVSGDGAGKVACGLAFFCDFELVKGVVEAGEA
jgi:hypothetical protein